VMRENKKTVPWEEEKTVKWEKKMAI
jgi:hypothetical protein